MLLALKAGEPFRLARALAWEAGHSSNPGLSARPRTDKLVATASEIAEHISRAGTPVSGRAIRHIAKVAGAVARPGDDGRMVYALS